MMNDTNSTASDIKREPETLLPQGSNPCRAANIAQQYEEFGPTDTPLTQETPESDKRVKFPKHYKHRGETLATMYGKSKSYPLYRVSWTVAGRRMMKAFPLYGAANRYAEKMKTELAKDSPATLLTEGQALDALAAMEVLQSFYEATGKRISLHGAAVQHTEAAVKLKDHSLTEAIDGFLGSVVTVKRMSVHEAIEQFIAFRKTKTLVADGRQG